MANSQSHHPETDKARVVEAEESAKGHGWEGFAVTGKSLSRDHLGHVPHQSFELGSENVVVVKWGDRVRRNEEGEPNGVLHRQSVREEKKAERGSRRQSAPQARQPLAAEISRSRNAFPRNSPKPDVLGDCHQPPRIPAAQLWATAREKVKPTAKTSSPFPHCPASERTAVPATKSVRIAFNTRPLQRAGFQK